MKKVLYIIGMSTILMNCGTKDVNSKTQVTNGVKTDLYPAVVRLDIKIGGVNKVTPCTGTFIAHDIVLTAAHCLTNAESIKFNGMEKLAEYMVPIFSPQSAYDLALLRFPANSAPAIMKVTTKPPKNGDKLILVGFGHNETRMEIGREVATERSTNNIKRIGYNIYKNEVSDRVKSHITFDGTNYFPNRANLDEIDLLDASAAPGDSGGPLIVEGKGIVGVTSFGQGFEDDNSKSTNFYVNLLSREAQDFFATAPLYGFELR